MSYKDKYLKMKDAYSHGSMRDSYIENTKTLINQLFLDNPSAKLIRFNDSDEEQWVWIVEDTKNSLIKKIIMPPDNTIKAGWMVHWNNEQWLCVKADSSNMEVYESGFIEKCNANLKWIDEEGVIYSYPCVFYYGAKANFGTYADRVMTLPDGRRQVVVQKNEHTMKIKRNDRFLFGGNAFIVIDHDYISEEGIVNINLKDDQYNPATDNLELGIANYYERFKNENDNHEDDYVTDGVHMVIKSTSSTPNEIRRNQTKEYYVEVYQEGEVLSGETVHWELYADDQISSTDLAVFSGQANTACVLKNNNSTSGFVQLKATLNSNDQVVAWLRIQMKSLF